MMPTELYFILKIVLTFSIFCGSIYILGLFVLFTLGNMDQWKWKKRLKKLA